LLICSQTVEIVSGGLRLRGGGEQVLRIVLQLGDPASDVPRVVLDVLGPKAVLCSQQACADLRDQLLEGTVRTRVGVAIEISIKPVLRSSPVRLMPTSA